MSTPAAVVMRRIGKRFGDVQANRDVDLTVATASVHGIVGENGAGKSTLMSILYGFYAADTGTITVDGRPLAGGSARASIAAGIGMVHQHFMLVDSLTALDNVLLGAEPDWRLQPARDQVRRALQALMHDTGLAVRLDLPVEDLPVGERQRLEILKALYRGARILILDEPTAVLTPQETAQLFDTLRGLRSRGTTILLISHKLGEIMALCDAVTVLRGGAVVLDTPIADTSADALAAAMVGRRVQPGRRTDTPPAHPGAVLLDAHNLRWCDSLGVARLDGVSLQLHAGEIVGIAGVTGNGQSELLDVLAGLLAPQQGSLQLGGRQFGAGHWLTPQQARTLKLAHVPEDRHTRALVLPFAAWEAAVLGYHRLAAFCRGGWMRNASMHGQTLAMMQRYDVRPLDPALRASKFSGGNQQKLVLAREAWAEPRVLLVGQPTRGVDIGAIEFIHARLRELRDAGGAVLVVSSELDEVLALADRVLVMHAGRVAGERAIAACDEATLGRLMGGVESAHG
jgi:simple sugar transport system ATP-binding protein